MDRKKLHKRKGQWVTISSSIIVASLAFQGVQLAQAQEITNTEEDIVSEAEVAAQLSTSTENQDYYVVQHGDYLYKIAQENGLTVDQLITYNNLKSNSLVSGQILYLVPGYLPSESNDVSNVEINNETDQQNNQTENQDNNNTQSQTVSGSTYIVQKGESLGIIGRKLGLSVTQLKQLNGLTSDLIHPNQVLKVSGTTQESTNSTDNDDAAVSETSNSNQINQTANTHTVKHGEYLYLIAKRYGLS
ncbi:LysM peptidoglycan-binding domain-containing protein, partial [Eremococcus coleocola]|uniref:LysM peptidoglycan-binding domain-containing protein n=1 Tax=Eremococcus coleocola TaxID=88132 RepID=UPI00048419BF